MIWGRRIDSEKPTGTGEYNVRTVWGFEIPERRIFLTADEAIRLNELLDDDSAGGEGMHADTRLLIGILRQVFNVKRGE